MLRWKMFAEIHQLKEQGFKRSQISRKLQLDPKTVNKYWDMEPDQFTVALKQANGRRKKLDKYETVIVKWLREHPDITAAQILDWLKEYYHEEPAKERTVRSYVSRLRAKYGIPKVAHPRQYQALEDPPMGYQLQLDFGQTKVRGQDNGLVKLYGLGSVLSHSRHKFSKWSEQPLTTNCLIRMLVDCFEFYSGVPKEIVIDQDKLMVVSENCGEIIYTHDFERFRRNMGFKVHLCRAGDPESKGRVEAVVKYMKYGFAAHRTFADVKTWNQQCLDWLHRTANQKVHGTTKKVPAEVFALEKEYLSPVPPLWNLPNNSVTRMVKKDNTIVYKSNRYSVPIGTYSRGLEVEIVERDNLLIILESGSGKTLAEHTLSKGKGDLIQNSNHLRNYNEKTDELYEKTLSTLKDIPEVDVFLQIIRKKKGRHVRDQYKLILKLQEKYSPSIIVQAFAYCKSYELYSAVALRDVAEYFNTAQEAAAASEAEWTGKLPEHLRVKVNTRDIKEYAGLTAGESA